MAFATNEVYAGSNPTARSIAASKRHSCAVARNQPSQHNAHFIYGIQMIESPAAYERPVIQGCHSFEQR